MAKPVLTLALAVLAILTACSITFDAPHIVSGSGDRASETRPLGSFTAIELAGSADVSVSFGETQSVVVETDDNLLELVETEVLNDALVIRHKPNSSITTSLGVRVTVIMASLERVTVSGSGNVMIADLDAGRVTFDLPGSGNITASGTADTVEATLNGSGNILCGDLEARTVEVHLNGSGNITVYATDSLTATISGSGTVQYAGNPGSVEQSVTGSGTIIAVP